MVCVTEREGEHCACCDVQVALLNQSYQNILLVFDILNLAFYIQPVNAFLFTPQ